MFKKIGNNFASRLSPTRTHWSGLQADVAARLRHFRQGRDSVPQKALERDFSLLLEAWGIKDETDIPGILLDLRLRCLFLAVPVPVAFASALLMSGGLYSLLTLILVAPPCLFGLLVTRWRMSILKNRAFRPLHRWLTACLTKKRSA